MYLMLQQDTPRDYVLATGITTTVREFVAKAFAAAEIQIQWQGNGVDEVGIDPATGTVRVAVDPRYYRPTEVELLLGDATRARQDLGWEPQYTLDALVQDMVQSDLDHARKDDHLRQGGFRVLNYFE
jgi:GDPmannose 4,6-dehydratase